jgi:SAM-dependent methyltransferase
MQSYVGGEREVDREMAEQPFSKSYGGNPAANYERFFVPVIGAPLATDLIRTSALRPSERVLDVACGTGLVARLASQQVPAGTVAALDINPVMLAVARSATSPGMSIEWREEGAEAMSFPDSTFHVVLCQMGLQFMPDKRAVLREMQRVLAPGGRLILNVPGPTPRLFAIMEDALARHIGAEAAAFVSQVFSLHDPTEVQSLVGSAGFHSISIQSDTRLLRLPAPEEFLWQYVHSTPLAALITRVSDEQRDSLEREVVVNWQELVEDRALMLQLRVVVAAARK